MKMYSSTKKGNYRQTSHKNSRFWLATAGVLICFGLIFPWLISTISAIVLYPVHVTTAWVKNGDGVFPNYLRGRASLVAEVESLKSELATKSGTQLTINKLVEENMQLRGMANAAGVEQRLVARVLARPNQLSYDLLQIDRGAKDGVVIGAPVYTGVDSVLGIVAYVTETYSFVDLFTSPGFESTAFIFGPNVFSPIEGMGGGVARVRLPQGVAIKEGQMVILPGVSNGIYGEIIRVENEPTQPEQYGYITPPLAMNNLLYVSVGLGSGKMKTYEEIDENIRKMLRESMKLDENSLFNYSTTTESMLNEDSTASTTTGI